MVKHQGPGCQPALVRKRLVASPPVSNTPDQVLSMSGAQQGRENYMHAPRTQDCYR
jgi:hypothetical protein